MFTSLPAYSTYRSRARILGIKKSARRESNPRPSPWQGDVVPLYYSRMCLFEAQMLLYLFFADCQAVCFQSGEPCPGSESNQRHKDFQSSALPTELPGLFSRPVGICRRPGSNRYEYHYSRDFKSRASASSATPARRGENGRRWIRTTEAFRSRFTVCPLWPLGNPPVLPRRALKISQHLEKCKQFF